MRLRCHGAVGHRLLRSHDEAATSVAAEAEEEIVAGTTSLRRSSTGKRRRTDTAWPQATISIQTRTGATRGQVVAGQRGHGNRKGARRGSSSGGATRRRRVGRPEAEAAVGDERRARADARDNA